MRSEAAQPEDPETPQPETPQPETPQPETPQPETPQPETPQPEDLEDPQPQDLVATVHSLRESIRRKNEQVTELRSSLLGTREQLNAKLEEARSEIRHLRRQSAELRSSLLETRRQLNAKLQEARAEVRQLKRQLAVYERRHEMKGVDAVAHNSESSMDEFFAETDDREPYVRFGSALRLELRKRGITLERRRVADAGVGPAIALKELLRGSEPGSVFGFDFSAAALEKAAAVLPSADFEQRDIYSELPARFDVIICTEVLEHLERPSDALRVLAEGMAPDGLLILTVPDGRIDFSAKHINFWSPESWALFLSQNLPKYRIETGVFQPYPETGHQTNLGIVRTS